MTKMYVKIDSDDGDTCYYTCPHCQKRSHSEFDKWTSVINGDDDHLICPKCGQICYEE